VVLHYSRKHFQIVCPHVLSDETRSQNIVKKLSVHGFVTYTSGVKILSFLLLVSLTFSVPPVHAANITAGSPCKSAGQKVIFKGKSHTCIKLGKKLYWDNGVTVKGKSGTPIAMPATCAVQNLQIRSISESGISNADGIVMFSADIANASNSQVATQVKIYVEWYDSVGISYKNTLLIPRIYPGQKIDFGSVETFQNGGGKNKSFPDEPLRISLRSSCKSSAPDPKELINGKFPILTGTAPVIVKEASFDGIQETYVSSSLILTNIFEKDMVISYEVYPESNKKVNIYGVFKDKFGNTIGGYTEYVRGDLQTLEKGDTARIDLSLFDLSDADRDFIERVATFTYTVIID